jgi:hypothetical protein
VARHSDAAALEGSWACALHRRRYLPALDGLRALAILPVILFHFRGDFTAYPVLFYVASRGWFGVVLFFTLSGLIASSVPTAEVLLQRRQGCRTGLPADAPVANWLARVWAAWLRRPADSAATSSRAPYKGTTHAKESLRHPSNRSTERLSRKSGRETEAPKSTWARQTSDVVTDGIT